MQVFEKKGVNTEDFKGKWIIYNYWADWCPPCIKELPELSSFYEDNKDKVNVFTYNFDQLEGEELRDQIKRFKVEVPSIITNPEELFGWETPASLPATFIVDPNGNLVKAASGGVGNASVYARDLFISGGGNRGITIHTTSTSGSRAGCIFFGEGTSVPDMASGILMFDHNSNHMHFSTGGSTNVGKSLRINNVGDVRFDSTPTSNHAMSVIIKSHKSRVVDDNNGICFLDANDHTQAVINVQKKSTSDATSDLVFRTSSGQVVNTLQGLSLIHI